jgi:hypothetical protein
MVVNVCLHYKLISCVIKVMNVRWGSRSQVCVYVDHKVNIQFFITRSLSHNPQVMPQFFVQFLFFPFPNTKIRSHF